MAYIKPQVPLKFKDSDGNVNYEYPLTTVDQVIDGDNRLNATMVRQNLEDTVQGQPNLTNADLLGGLSTMSYVKPQSPMKVGNDNFYPLTTIDQIIKSDGSRLSEDDFGFYGIDTDNIIASGTGVILPYTATEDCWIMAMAYGSTKATINGCNVFTSATATYGIVPLKKGQTYTGRTDDATYRIVYGLKK